jgi:hypothetical protein
MTLGHAAWMRHRALTVNPTYPVKGGMSWLLVISVTRARGRRVWRKWVNATYLGGPPLPNRLLAAACHRVRSESSRIVRV